jgi:uncharacterized membrane protein
VPTHLFVAHAPITLILVGAGVDVLGALRGDEQQRRWGGVLLMLGAAAALLAFFTGQGAVPYAFARPQPNYAQIDAHTQWAGAAVWLLAIGGGLRAVWRHHLRGLYGWINLAIGLVSGLLIIGITYSGLAIAHGG